MKNPYLFVMGFALAASALFCSCRRNTITPPSVSQQIVGKWTVQTAIGSYVYAGVTQNDTISFGAPNYFEFNADSTLNIWMDSVAYNGTWSIASSRLFISGTGYMDVQTGYSKGFTLPILTASALQLEYRDTTGPATSDQILNLSK